MILAIRISGHVEVSEKMEQTLDEMRLRRKYAAILMHETPLNLKLLQHVRNYVAYGRISEENLKKLIELRGQPIKKGTKIDSAKISGQLGSKKLDELGLKPFFRLHPPRGGIESKKHFGVGKGVLGDNQDKINKLVERMF